MHQDTIFVGPDGSNEHPGTRAEPLAEIDLALQQADPGEMVYVLPGEYNEVFSSWHPGEPDRPITVTGPPDAVIRASSTDPEAWGFSIHHSHIHLTGLTFDGLADPTKPDDADEYGRNAIVAKPPVHEDTYPDYLTDVKIMPHAIGNTRRRHVNTYRVNNLEIGEFEVIGPAGVAYTLGELEGHRIGAIIATGRSSNNFGTDAYPWNGPDESHNIHIHHVANLEGYEHTELVKTHAGNYDVTVEYCSDLGRSGRKNSPGVGSVVTLVAGRSTVRWNTFTNADGNGVYVYIPAMKENESYEAFDHIPEDRFPSLNNAIYGNQLLDNGKRAIAFSSPDWIDNGLNAQEVICGNEYNGDTQADPDKPCNDDVPETETIGHLGGDSPWV